MRFYGISPNEILDSDNELIESLYECIPTIQAQEILIQLRALDFPMMKDEARRKLHKDLNKQAFPRILKAEEKALTTADLANLLKG